MKQNTEIRPYSFPRKKVSGLNKQNLGPSDHFMAKEHSVQNLKRIYFEESKIFYWSVIFLGLQHILMDISIFHFLSL